MDKAAYLHAIAGLLHDPLINRARQWIPAGWEGASPDTISLSSRLAAGAMNIKTEAASGQLQSVLSTIQADGEIAAAAHWPLGLLNLETTPPFPTEKQESTKAASARQALVTSLDNEVSVLKALYEKADEADLPLYVENLMLSMQRHAWCLPSAYFDELPDASLYDHSRMTAALSAILAGSEPSADLKANPSNSESSVALLIGGDISGIQDFIYQVSSRGATPAMRGRSFYLQLLGEVIPRFILHELDLPITNLIYAGGGHFFMLIRPSQKEELDSLRARISRVLLYHHRGDLYLAITSVPLAGKDFFGKGIAEKWEELRRALQQTKACRFSELGSDLNYLFIEQDHGGNEEKQCQVCGLEHQETRLERREADEEGVRKCPVCISYEDLGDDLRRADWLVLKQINSSSTPDLLSEWIPGDYKKVLGHFGIEVSVARDMPSVDGPATVLALGDYGDKFQSTTKVAVGRRFIVNVTPLLSEEDRKSLKDRLTEEEWKDLPAAGRIKPFDVLEKQSQGIPRLGVLRMDVDNMGDMFTEGLGDKASLARLAALSFCVHLFFEGWVGHLAEQRNREDGQNGRGERLYSIYSGGDDLFFVGSWDAVTDLAVQIRSELGRYANYHPGVHVSAGIVLVGGKYPLAQAAQDAGRAEHAAKNLQWFVAGKRMRKDAVTFLGKTLPWAKFSQQHLDEAGQNVVQGMMQHLRNLVEKQGANKQLLRLLMQLQTQYDEALRKRRLVGKEYNRLGEQQFPWGPWMWLGDYYLARQARQAKSKVLEDEIKKIKEDIKTNFHHIEWIGLAARWAELLTR